MPIRSQVVDSRFVESMSVALIQSSENFAAGKVFPSVPTAQLSGSYVTYGNAGRDFARDMMQLREPGANFERAQWDVGSGTYSIKQYAIEAAIADEIEKSASNPVQPMESAGWQIAQAALIRKELLFASNYFTTSVWGTDITPGNLWSDYTNSDPIGDVNTGIETILKAGYGVKPNVMVCGTEVWNQLKHHPNIIERINGAATPGMPAIANLQNVAAVLELEEIIVSGAVYEPSADGTAAAPAFVLGKHALLCHKASSPGMGTPSAGYHFTWTEDGSNSEGVVMEQYRDEAVKSEIMRGQLFVDPKVIASTLGYFFNSVVA